MDPIEQPGNFAGINTGGSNQPDDDGFIVIDPASGGAASGGSNNSGGSYTGRRRGRKPGSRNTASKDQANLRGLDIAEILLSAHMMLAIALKTPQLVLEKTEAEKLEEAIQRVWRHYPMDVSQKHLDISMALFTVASIYGTRAVAIFTESRVNQRAQPRESGGVVQFPIDGRGGHFPGG